MTSITIRDDVPARSVGSELWGIFFEDLNYAADGGLYAELIQNRSFEYSHRDHQGWGPLTAWLRTGRVEIHHDSPLSSSAPNYARLFADGDSAAITNEGFDGITVVEGGLYMFSVYARAEQVTDLRVSLETPEHEQFVHLSVNSGEWTRYTTLFKAGTNSPNAKLKLSVYGTDRVDLDFVSLFPGNTFGRAQNGLRQDLGEAIADLRPKFMRFPGGCLAHGLGLENLYQWKDTVGRLYERRQNFNLWGYHQSMGLGYYEYFQFSEQIGAAPLPVLAAGVCCQNLVGGPEAIPLDQMEAYIQDVLDLIEFANGSIDTPWGRRRAALGHPESFELRYLAIGNEDLIDATFRNRFQLIFDTVLAAHPEIQIVGTSGPAPFGRDYEDGWKLARELRVPIVDEHMYRAPKWFFENTHRYDSYDRSGPQVYVGEYGSKGNRLINALSEAAFMLGMERNGDIVRFASYAPLLAKLGHTQWVPDLIYFDNNRVLPSLNYYVQQMFSHTAGDLVEPTEIVDAPHFERPTQPFTGILLETAGMEVAFEHISLNGTALSDVTLLADERRELDGRSTEADYTIRLKATARTGDQEGSFGIHFGAIGTGDSFEWNFGSWRNSNLVAFYTADGDRDELLEPQPFLIEFGRSYDVEIRVSDRGQHIEFILDGKSIQTRTPPEHPEQRFFASSVVDSTTGRRFVRIVNATGTPSPVSLAFASGSAATVRRVISLAGEWDAGAPFEVAPYMPVETLGSETSVEVPPYSFLVLELE